MKNPSDVILDGHSLDIEDLLSIAHGDARATFGAEALARMASSRQVIDAAIGSGAVVYGVNTGFGKLSSVTIPRARLGDLQRNLIRSHAAGVGDPLPRDATRAAMALRANVLARGHSGVRPETAEALVSMLNAGVHPVIPERGSVGASGDLAPLAHIALVLIGEGRAEVDGEVVDGGEALRRRGLAAVELAAKEGIALVNGTQVSAAIGALAIGEAERLLAQADVIGALTLDALKGSVRAFDARIVEARGHAGAATAARRLRELLAGSAIMESHRECGRVQDAYSLRCMPQVHGAARDAIAHARAVLEIEMNASTDNPMVFGEGPDGAAAEVISGGNFHGAPIGMVLDYATIALTQAASISERRIERLVNPDLSELPAFLAPDGGANSGFMMAQVTAAALVSECKVLSHPASVDSIPTSANKEDHVPMSTHAARKCRTVADLYAHVLAVEALVAAQALDFLAPLRSSERLEAVRRAIRARVPFMDVDREVHRDIVETRRLLAEGALARAAGLAVGGRTMGPEVE